MGHSDNYSVVLDTCFLINLVDANTEMHSEAVEYFRYFASRKIPMYISTISIAEYCVSGDLTGLPLKNLRIVPFNTPEAVLAGKYAGILFDARRRNELDVQRIVIPNDVKIFAAVQVCGARYFVTSDTKSAELLGRIAGVEPLSFSHLDIHTKIGNVFGELDL